MLLKALFALAVFTAPALSANIGGNSVVSQPSHTAQAGGVQAAQPVQPPSKPSHQSHPTDQPPPGRRSQQPIF